MAPGSREAPGGVTVLREGSQGGQAGDSEGGSEEVIQVGESARGMSESVEVSVSVSVGFSEGGDPAEGVESERPPLEVVQVESPLDAAGGATPGDHVHAAMSSTRTAQLASLAEQADLRCVPSSSHRTDQRDSGHLAHCPMQL